MSLWFCRAVPLVLFVVLISGCNGGSSDGGAPSITGVEFSNDPGWHQGGLEHNGLMRVFRYYVPENVPETAPTVLLLHGGTQSMDTIFSSNAGGTEEWETLAEEEKIVLLVPNGTDPATGNHTGDNQFWNDCRMPGTVNGPQSMSDDVGFLMKLGELAELQLPVDPDRFYVTGSSNGGQMAFRLAIERPERVSAIAVFIANMPVESECPAPSTPVPVFLLNGTEDPITPYDGGDADGRGPFVSAPGSRDIWVGVNNADPSSRLVTEIEDIDPNDGSHVICEDDPPGSSGAPVRFCRVEGGGHTMPTIEHPIRAFVEAILGPQNRDVEGARLAWQFLQRHGK